MAAKNKKKLNAGASSDSLATTTNDDTKKKKSKPQATVSEVFIFVWACGAKVKITFALGTLAGILHGLVFPALAYVFSTSFSDIAGAAFNGLGQIKELAFIFMGVGAYALGVATVQSWCFEIVAYHASQRFRLTWFKSLLHQDPAFFDVYDIGGVAAQVGANANKFRRGIGRKLGEGIQFLTTGIGGLAYAIYSSWTTALVILGIVPFVALVSIFVLQVAQTKGSRQAKAYKEAGGVAYSAVAAIKTVLSLNAVKDMVLQYTEATDKAFKTSVGVLLKQGFMHGSMMGSFFFFYFILTLYGTWLLYTDILNTGCDPSGAIWTNQTCTNSGSAVFGAMLGIAFAAQGISQVGNFFEAFSAARVATYEALIAIKRVPGTPSETIYKSEDDDDDTLSSTTHSRNSRSGHMKQQQEDVEAADGPQVKAILPKYEIDSASSEGIRPTSIRGAIAVRNVYFSYPTRPNDSVLNGLSLTIEAGQTVAFVGPSGGGKSTIVAMLERFYDPLQGMIELDGMNLKSINVAHLRRSIGYVGQEPALFATTIRGNIKYGNPNATEEQIIEAAKLANAHDFISAFSDGYDTQVGDKGSQLSGGQKQRIAIARVLVGDPRILLLDEATSALDAESELVVQKALDNIVARKKLTTIIIAHRLSTIRNADVINVVVSGRVAEQGTHEELMASKTYYRKLVEKQEGLLDEDEDAAVAIAATPGATNPGDNDVEVRLDQVAASMRSVDMLPHLEFRNVTFNYPSRPKKKVLNDFNLVIQRGQTLALVGPSGGGKSTTVGLIERFYDPNEGEVLYLGHDLKSLNVDWYRSELAYVGQEPTLFNMTIEENIKFGLHGGATRAEVEQAARQANAHDFIMEFPEGYETPVGSRGTQLSGGQKQRVAIARALVRKPRFLILDEATSALDNESESVVQDAIDKLMSSHDHTVVVIAHRLSTIRNADKIAVISDGQVVEYGSHDELVQNPTGRYKRLVESSKRRSNLDTMKAMRRSNGKKAGDADDEEEEEMIDWEAKIREEEEKAFNGKRARSMASPDVAYMIVGAIGALMAGGVFPAMGVLFSETITLLFQPVFQCPLEDGSIPPGNNGESFAECGQYYDYIALTMKKRSYQVATYWAVVLVCCVLGNTLTFWGFGSASERLNKRVRDTSFMALLRQEVAFFDKRSVGSITSQLQDDAAKIHAFSGEPVRSFLVAVSSLITGVVISLIYMWQFALLAIACVPIMGAATALEMKKFLGEDESELNKADELNSPGGVIVETLLNVRTVAALTLEETRYEDYQRALYKSEPNYRFEAFMAGFTAGISMFIQQWINALQFWFGGWLLFRFPETYTFNDYLISNFCVLFALFGLGAAFQDMSDRKEVEKSVGRIFYLLDRQSEIDPLSKEGKKLSETEVTVSC